MRIAIIGAGHLGYIIAEFLSNEQYDVVVVDSDESKLDAIRDALDVLTIHADGTSPSFMRDEDMKGTDIVVAVTAIDEVNIIASSPASSPRRTASPIPSRVSGTRSSLPNRRPTSEKISTSTFS